MAVYVIAFLVVTNLISLGLYFRARHLNRMISKHTDALREWLKVHVSLQRASGSVLQIRRIEEDGIMYREPSR